MDDVSQSGVNTEQTLSKYDTPKGIVLRWLKEISLVEQNRKQQNFQNIGERIIRKFRNASDVDTVGTGRWSSNVMYNVLWSNVQVLEPALYSRMPKVMVERTFKDSDPVGRLAAEVAERATHYNLLSQQDRFNYAVTGAVQDRLLVGRGITKLQYHTEFITATDANGDPLTEGDKVIQKPKPNSQRVLICPVNWLDYLESIARNQFEVRWRRFKIYMTRAELVKEFGKEIGNAIELESNPKNKDKKGYGDDDADFLEQAVINVIEDISSKKVYWISPGYLEAPLKMLDDPYKIRDFWSCPLPLTATTTTDSTYPTADYVIYQGLADELNFVTTRLKNIVNCIRLVGAHAEAFNNSIKNITTLSDGTTWPIAQWGEFVNKGGFKGMLDWVPFDQCVAAIPPLMEYQSSIKAQIDEITSMPDIVRGSSDPNDPVYTQQQKSHWTVIKLVKKQQDVQRFCREIVSKMAEMIFEPGFFDDETIMLMAGVAQMTPDKQANFPQALALLRDDRLNTFRIDIETDSTIAIDEDQAMERWMKYLSAMRDIVGEVQQISESAPELMQPIVESALGAVRSLRTGRSVEGAWEKALDEMEANKKAALENPQPPPPDPALLKAQTDQMKAQADIQMKQQEDQYNWQMEQQKTGFDQWEKGQRLQLDTQKMEGDFALKDQANQIAAGQAMSRETVEKMYADIDAFQKQFQVKLDGLRVKLESDRLEFDKQAKVYEMKEKFMEEKRLDRQDNIQVAELQQRQTEHGDRLEHMDRTHDEKMQLEEKKLKAKPKQPAKK